MTYLQMKHQNKKKQTKQNTNSLKRKIEKRKGANKFMSMINDIIKSAVNNVQNSKEEFYL